MTNSKVIKFMRPDKIKIDSLIDCYNKFLIRYEFKQGDIVQWKPKFRNSTITGPFLVLEVLKEPVFDHNIPSDCYFNEPLDIIVGVIDSDECFWCYHFDSRRLEPYKLPET